MQVINYSKLKNGLTVSSDHSEDFETVTIMAMFKVGSKMEDDSNRGISHFIEHMFFKGTENMTAKQISEEVDAVGGIINAFTSKEFTAYYVKCLKKDAELAVRILSEMLTKSTFPEEEMLKEKGVVCQEILSSLDSPDDIVFDLFSERFIKDHSIAKRILGTQESVNAMSRTDCLNYIKRFYTPDNMIFASCGNLDHSSFEKLVEKYMSNYTGQAEIYTQKKMQFESGKEINNKPNLEQVQYILGFEGVSYVDDERYKLSVLSNVLGGGMSSRLFQKIRENLGLVYTISCFNESFNDGGLFTIYAGTEGGNIEKLEAGIMEELHAISNNDILQSELSKTVNQVQASIAMSLESQSSRARKIATDYLVHGEYQKPSDTLEKIRLITQQDIKSIAAKIFASPSMNYIYGKV